MGVWGRRPKTPPAPQHELPLSEAGRPNWGRRPNTPARNTRWVGCFNPEVHPTWTAPILFIFNLCSGCHADSVRQERLRVREASWAGGVLDILWEVPRWRATTARFGRWCTSWRLRKTRARLQQVLEHYERISSICSVMFITADFLLCACYESFWKLDSIWKTEIAHHSYSTSSQHCTYHTRVHSTSSLFWLLHLVEVVFVALFVEVVRRTPGSV